MANRTKLTERQKKEIFDHYMSLRTHKERWGFQREMAEKYGVHKNTIQRIVYDERRMEEYLRRVNHVRDIATVHLAQNLDRAVEVEEKILGMDVDPMDGKAGNLLYLQHQAAESLFKRVGVEAKREEKENEAVKIEFVGGGFDVGMPDRTDEDDEDAVEYAESEID